MKIRKLLINTSLAAISILAISCSETISQVDDSLATTNEEKSSEIALNFGDSCTFTGELTDSEIAGLMEMREEEKLAHDVYQYFYEMYDYIIFNNISESEAAHTGAVLYLINGYGLQDPAMSEPGVFSNPLFNELYATLTEQGAEDIVAALKTGAYIEEYDINDLQNLLDDTQNADVIRVYSNLLQGSESHLRAFSKILGQFGEVYDPQIISAEEYETILSGTNSKGNGNNSNYGNGYENSGSGSGAQYGNNNSPQGNQNQNSNSSGTATCDGTGPNF